MANLNQGFPHLNTPMVDPETGLVSQAWSYFLLTMWNRTGGAIGTNLDDALVQSDLSDTDTDPVALDQATLKALMLSDDGSGSGASLELTDGTHDVRGVSKITVANMTVGGTPTASTLAPNIATALAPGIVQPDGTIITVSGGDITVPKTSSSVFGVAKVDGTSITALAGVISATSASGANPTATAGPAAVNGVATTFMRSDAAPAIQKASASQFGIVEVDGVTITSAAGVISAVSGGSGTVTTTGTPASGNLAKFSGTTSITNADLSGDVTTSGTLATTLATVNGNVGQFTAITVNGKGLATAATNLALTGDVTGTASGAGLASTIKTSVALAGSPTTTTQTAGDSSTKIATTAFVQTIAPGRLLNVQYITATGAGTYAPSAGTNSVIIELQGAGGGGGGTPSPGALKVGNASGGGGGAWGRFHLTSNFSGAAYSIGAKGTGGAAGANSGNNGGNTTFTNTAGSPTTWTAGGGTGGFAGGTGATPPTFSFAAAGGVTSGGAFDSVRPGGDSDPGVAPASGQEFSGRGGSSMYSPGAVVTNLFTTTGQTAGASAGGKGGGGGAAVATGASLAAAGGDASDGMIIFWELS